MTTTMNIETTLAAAEEVGCPSRSSRRRTRRAWCLATAVAAVILWPLGLAGQAGEVPTPLSHFGFTPGENRRLADWHELSSYYDRVALASPRVSLDTIGATTGGLPFVLLTITSPENHARIEELREIHLRLADPRRVRDDAELRRLREEARAVVLLTSHIHSTEVGAGQMPANLVHHLASSEEPDVLEILDRVILLVVPSLNPDGTQRVSEWYRRHVGTPFEGTEPVELYHEYVGHDNNRDWYALTQVETRLTVEHVHNAWRPMIVHDVHQMGAMGARMFVPPYVDPVERNVDPLIVTAINQLGSYMAAELTLGGKTGVVTSSQFDLFTPARAYPHYHGGVRILSETASAALATPIELAPERLFDGPGFRATEPSMNFPAPWSGGVWGLPEIVDYQQSGAMALLRHAARNRAYWVSNFHAIGRRAADGWPDWPRYWIIPDVAGERTGLDALLRVLTLGLVEVHRATAAFSADGRRFPAGTYLIPMNQPYAAWAQSLLEPQRYPDLMSYPGGPPLRPYDVTAHTLPLLMGVQAYATDTEIDVPRTDPIPPVDVDYRGPESLVGADAPRIGLYRGWRESIQAGWTRWLFDQHNIPYHSIHDADLVAGDLNRRFDVIVFQDQPSTFILRGWFPGQQPTEYTGGIGERGLEAIRRFVQEGGRLVAIESATDLFMNAFSLPVFDALRDRTVEEFFIPGSILSLSVSPVDPIVAGGNTPEVAWFWRSSRAFEVVNEAVDVVATYGEGDPRLSGWVLGGEHVAGKPAIVRVPFGRGSIVLFGFQPNYRGHSIATWPLLFGSLR